MTDCYHDIDRITYHPYMHMCVLCGMRFYRCDVCSKFNEEECYHTPPMCENFAMFGKDVLKMEQGKR